MSFGLWKIVKVDVGRIAVKDVLLICIALWLVRASAITPIQSFRSVLQVWSHFFSICGHLSFMSPRTAMGLFITQGLKFGTTVLAGRGFWQGVIVESGILDEQGWSGLTGCSMEGGGGWMFAALLFGRLPCFLLALQCFPSCCQMCIITYRSAGQKYLSEGYSWDTSPLSLSSNLNPPIQPCGSVSEGCCNISHAGMNTCWTC